MYPQPRPEQELAHAIYHDARTKMPLVPIYDTLGTTANISTAQGVYCLQANGLILPAPTAPRTPLPAESKFASHPTEKSGVKEEPVDPMDLGDEEIDYELDRLNDESRNEVLPPDLPEGVELIDIDEALKFVNFKLPPPREVSLRASLQKPTCPAGGTSITLLMTGAKMGHHLIPI